jgi:hypothetical protein
MCRGKNSVERLWSADQFRVGQARRRHQERPHPVEYVDVLPGSSEREITKVAIEMLAADPMVDAQDP